MVADSGGSTSFSPRQNPSPAQIDQGLDGVDLIALKGEWTHPFLDLNANSLGSLLPRPGIPNGVVPEYEIPDLATDSNPGSFSGGCVVLDHVFNQAVPVPRHSQGFVAEEHTTLGIIQDVILLNQLIGMHVTDGDPEPSVPLQAVSLKEPVPDSPAKEETVLAIPSRRRPKNLGPLRTTSRMNAQVAVADTGAVSDGDIIGLLKTDPITVVILDHAVFNDRPEPPVEENPRPAAPVEIGVL